MRLLPSSCLGFWPVLAFLLSPCCSPAAPEPARPNIIFILADDMGFSDAGCYGGEIKTPNLDGLAQGGLRFSQFYNTARCWPSRAALLSGYYAQQVGRDALPGRGGGAQGKRPAWASLLPEMLKGAGYRSYHSGKWHVDGPVLAAGFEHSYLLDDHDRYFNPRRHSYDDQPLPPVPANSGFYVTTEIANRAVTMLATHQQTHPDQPFFLYLAFTSPHFPLQAPAEDCAVYTNCYQQGWDTLRKDRADRLEKLGLALAPFHAAKSETLPRWNLKGDQVSAQLGAGEAETYQPWPRLTAEQQAFLPGKMAIHAAMIHRMDLEIGRVLAQVRKMNAWENTLIMFAADNGASAEQFIRGDKHDQSARPGSAESYLCLGPGWAGAANTPFRFYKIWVHEGGISTPFIMHWPARIRPGGAWRHTPAHLIDVVPTLLELTGARATAPERPPFPGRSLTPVFTADVTVPREDLWWLHSGNKALRAGEWKLVSEEGKAWELYHVGKDRSETVNEAAKHPKLVKELAARWEQRTVEIKAVAPTQQQSAKRQKKAS